MKRGQGHTTGLILRGIASAILDPGYDVEVKDLHCGPHILMDIAHGIIAELRLRDIATRPHGHNTIAIKSMYLVSDRCPTCGQEVEK